MNAFLLFIAIVFSAVVAFGISMSFTAKYILASNDLGDSEGTYDDFL